MSISRRHFLAAAAALPLLGRGEVARAQSDGVPRIGSHKSLFDATFASAGSDGNQALYHAGPGGSTIYRVLFNEGGTAIQVLGDHRGNSGGGLAYVREESGISRFAPTDATGSPVSGFRHGYNRPWVEGRYWQSPSVASALGNGGHFTIMDSMGGDSPYTQVVQSTSIALEGAVIHHIQPLGTELGAHNSPAEWEAAHAFRPHQFGIGLDSPKIPGDWSLVGPSNTSLVVTLETPLSTGDIARVIGERLPTSARLLFSTWVGASDLNMFGMRIHVFRADDLNVTLMTMQLVDGTNERDGTVKRFHINLI